MSEGAAIDGRDLEEEIVRMTRAAFQEDAASILRQAGRLAVYLGSLLEANRGFNLVSERSGTISQLVERHLRDSLFGLRFLERPGGKRPLRLLDIGSGGGFPAVPLLIVRQDLEGWLFESTAKKSRFLAETLRRLSLTSSVVNARFPPPRQMSEIPPIDILTTRAVAGAGNLVRKAQPYLAPGARAFLWTSRPLYERAAREAGIHRSAFHGTPGTERSGIAVLDCST